MYLLVLTNESSSAAAVIVAGWQLHATLLTLDSYISTSLVCSSFLANKLAWMIHAELVTLLVTLLSCDYGCNSGVFGVFVELLYTRHNQYPLV